MVHFVVGTSRKDAGLSAVLVAITNRREMKGVANSLLGSTGAKAMAEAIRAKKERIWKVFMVFSCWQSK